MKNIRIMENLRMIMQIILGMIFLYASIDKIIYPANFAEVIYHYKILPLTLINIFAIIIPWVEFSIGILLLFDIWTDVALFSMITLTNAFVVLILIAMARGLNIECGCFSLDSHKSFVGWKRIIEDLIIIAAGIFIFIQSFISSKSN